MVKERGTFITSVYTVKGLDLMVKNIKYSTTMYEDDQQIQNNYIMLLGEGGRQWNIS